MARVWDREWITRRSSDDDFVCIQNEPCAACGGKRRRLETVEDVCTQSYVAAIICCRCGAKIVDSRSNLGEPAMYRLTNNARMIGATRSRMPA